MISHSHLKLLFHKLNNKACSVLGHIDLININELPTKVKPSFEVIKKNLEEVRSILNEINFGGFWDEENDDKV
jgi:hypothetical protein